MPYVICSNVMTEAPLGEVRTFLLTCRADTAGKDVCPDATSLACCVCEKRGLVHADSDQLCSGCHEFTEKRKPMCLFAAQDGRSFVRLCPKCTEPYKQRGETAIYEYQAGVLKCLEPVQLCFGCNRAVHPACSFTAYNTDADTVLCCNCIETFRVRDLLISYGADTAKCIPVTPFSGKVEECMHGLEPTAASVLVRTLHYRAGVVEEHTDHLQRLYGNCTRTCAHRTLALFHKVGGFDVLLAILLVREYDAVNNPPTHSGVAYISYLDSVYHVNPGESKRRFVQAFLRAYATVAASNGFPKLFLWACPPQGGQMQKYVIYGQPPDQRAGGAAVRSSKDLVQWYFETFNNATGSQAVSRLFDTPAQIPYFGDDLFSRFWDDKEYKAPSLKAFKPSSLTPQTLDRVPDMLKAAHNVFGSTCVCTQPPVPGSACSAGCPETSVWMFEFAGSQQYKVEKEQAVDFNLERGGFGTQKDTLVFQWERRLRFDTRRNAWFATYRMVHHILASDRVRRCFWCHAGLLATSVAYGFGGFGDVVCGACAERR